MHVFHSRDCSQQLRWCLTCRQHQLMRSHFILCSALSPQTLSAVIKGHQDVQKAAQQHWVCADLLWPTEAFEWSSAKALDSDGNLGQGWNQSHASKTKRQNNQGQRAVLRCRARTGSHVFWVKALAGLTLRQPLRHQGCHSPALLPNNRGSNGHHHFPYRLPGSINAPPLDVHKNTARCLNPLNWGTDRISEIAKCHLQPLKTESFNCEKQNIRFGKPERGRNTQN